MITGLDWEIQSGISGQLAGAGIALETPAAFLGGLFTDSDVVRSDGHAGRHVSVPNVVVKRGATTLCVAPDGGSLAQERIHGFFAKDK